MNCLYKSFGQTENEGVCFFFVIHHLYEFHRLAEGCQAQCHNSEQPFSLIHKHLTSYRLIRWKHLHLSHVDIGVEDDTVWKLLKVLHHSGLQQCLVTYLMVDLWANE